MRSRTRTLAEQGPPTEEPPCPRPPSATPRFGSVAIGGYLSLMALVSLLCVNALGDTNDRDLNERNSDAH